MFNKIKTHDPIYTLVKNKDILDICIERTNTHSIIIPHVCNNVNTFGAGFASYLSSKFPHVKENFHLLGKAKLGYTQFVDAYRNKFTDNKIIIANMIAQNGLINKNNPRPLNYYSLSNCMNTIRIYINDLLSKDSSTEIEIHSPKFGSGLAGGDWKFISCLIKDIWYNISVYIYQK